MRGGTLTRSARVGRWLDAREVERTGRFGPTGALLTVVLLYVLGFGMGIAAAVIVVTRPNVHFHVHGSVSWPALLELALSALAVVVAVPLLAREAPAWARPTGRRPRWLSELKAFGLAIFAIFVGSTAVRALGWLPHPHLHTSSSGWSGWSGIVAGLLAGPSEEIVVLVVPVVFLRAAKWPWAAVIAAMLALRLAYHVYYGFPVAGFAIWAVAMIFIYLGTHAIIGLIVAHSYWDTTLMLGQHWPLLSGLLISGTLLALFVWGVVSLILWLVYRSDRKAANRAAAAWPVGWYRNNSGYWWWWDGQRWLAPAPPGPGADPSAPSASLGQFGAMPER